MDSSGSSLVEAEASSFVRTQWSPRRPLGGELTEDDGGNWKEGHPRRVLYIHSRVWRRLPQWPLTSPFLPLPRGKRDTPQSSCRSSASSSCSSYCRLLHRAQLTPKHSDSADDNTATAFPSAFTSVPPSASSPSPSSSSPGGPGFSYAPWRRWSCGTSSFVCPSRVVQTTSTGDPHAPGSSSTPRAPSWRASLCGVLLRVSPLVQASKQVCILLLLLPWFLAVVASLMAFFSEVFGFTATLAKCALAYLCPLRPTSQSAPFPTLAKQRSDLSRLCSVFPARRRERESKAFRAFRQKKTSASSPSSFRWLFLRSCVLLSVLCQSEEGSGRVPATLSVRASSPLSPASAPGPAPSTLSFAASRSSSSLNTSRSEPVASTSTATDVAPLTSPQSRGVSSAFGRQDSSFHLSSSAVLNEEPLLVFSDIKGQRGAGAVPDPSQEHLRPARGGASLLSPAAPPSLVPRSASSSSSCISPCRPSEGSEEALETVFTTEESAASSRGAENTRHESSEEYPPLAERAVGERGKDLEESRGGRREGANLLKDKEEEKGLDVRANFSVNGDVRFLPQGNDAPPPTDSLSDSSPSFSPGSSSLDKQHHPAGEDEEHQARVPQGGMPETDSTRAAEGPPEVAVIAGELPEAGRWKVGDDAGAPGSFRTWWEHIWNRPSSGFTALAPQADEKEGEKEPGDISRGGREQSPASGGSVPIERDEEGKAGVKERPFLSEGEGVAVVEKEEADLHLRRSGVDVGRAIRGPAATSRLSGEDGGEELEGGAGSQWIRKGRVEEVRAAPRSGREEQDSRPFSTASRGLSSKKRETPPPGEPRSSAQSSVLLHTDARVRGGDLSDYPGPASMLLSTRLYAAGSIFICALAGAVPPLLFLREQQREQGRRSLSPPVGDLDSDSSHRSGEGITPATAKYIRLTMSFTGGVLLSVGLLHLLPSAERQIANVFASQPRLHLLGARPANLVAFPPAATLGDLIETEKESRGPGHKKAGAEEEADVDETRRARSLKAHGSSLSEAQVSPLPPWTAAEKGDEEEARRRDDYGSLQTGGAYTSETGQTEGESKAGEGEEEAEEGRRGKHDEREERQLPPPQVPPPRPYPIASLCCLCGVLLVMGLEALAEAEHSHAPHTHTHTHEHVLTHVHGDARTLYLGEDGLAVQTPETVMTVRTSKSCLRHSGKPASHGPRKEKNSDTETLILFSSEDETEAGNIRESSQGGTVEPPQAESRLRHASEGLAASTEQPLTASGLQKRGWQAEAKEGKGKKDGEEACFESAHPKDDRARKNVRGRQKREKAGGEAEQADDETGGNRRQEEGVAVGGSVGGPLGAVAHPCVLPGSSPLSCKSASPCELRGRFARNAPFSSHARFPSEAAPAESFFSDRLSGTSAGDPGHRDPPPVPFPVPVSSSHHAAPARAFAGARQEKEVSVFSRSSSSSSSDESQGASRSYRKSHSSRSAYTAGCALSAAAQLSCASSAAAQCGVRLGGGNGCKCCLCTDQETPSKASCLTVLRWRRAPNGDEGERVNGGEVTEGQSVVGVGGFPLSTHGASQGGEFAACPYRLLSEDEKAHVPESSACLSLGRDTESREVPQLCRKRGVVTADFDCEGSCRGSPVTRVERMETKTATKRFFPTMGYSRSADHLGGKVFSSESQRGGNETSDEDISHHTVSGAVAGKERTRKKDTKKPCMMGDAASLAYPLLAFTSPPCASLCSTPGQGPCLIPGGRENERGIFFMSSVHSCSLSAEESSGEPPEGQVKPGMLATFTGGAARAQRVGPTAAPGGLTTSCMYTVKNECRSLCNSRLAISCGRCSSGHDGTKLLPPYGSSSSSASIADEGELERGSAGPGGKARDLLVSSALMLALSFHSLMEGVTLGTTLNPQLVAFAVLVHKALESFALGSSLLQAQTRVLTFIWQMTLFASMTPVGVLLGVVATYFTQGGDTAPGSLASSAVASSTLLPLIPGLLTGIGSGTFLHVSLLECIAPQLMRCRSEGKASLLSVVAAVCVGAFVMILLA